MDDADLLRDILDAQLEMVCRFRPDGTILFVNRSYADTLGRSPQELTGANLWAFITPEDRARVESALHQITPENRLIWIENRLETVEGTRWTLWLNRGIDWDHSGNLIEAQATGFDATECKLLEEQRQLLINELNHRVRNTLTIVQGMAHQTFRRSDMPADHLDAFNARLHALAAAHTALTLSNWEGAELAEVVRQGLAICGPDISRIAIAGPPVRLRPNAAVTVTLVMHELATNALKYGALFEFDGNASVSWGVIDADQLELVWQERGGPTVVPPVSPGFGFRLITSSIARQLGGRVDTDFEPEGLTCRMAFPLHSARLGGDVF
ncbi:MAG TPA: HWE histidine kinase domain-containing protein [Novosphingobium sp.]